MRKKPKERFRAIAAAVTTWAGSPPATISAILSILAWAALGPAMKFSESWQLWANTGTTIVTFLMVFFIQNSQNRDSKAIQVKLNAILAGLDGASNKLIDLENQAEDELDEAVEEIKQFREK